MDADTIIVGGGIVGLWTAYHLAAQGFKTILFEQFPYPHTRGSSHGPSRITRTSYTEEEYAEMMPECHRLWRDLEKYAGKQLLVSMRLVSLFNMEVKFRRDEFRSMVDNLETHRIKYRVIDGEKLEKNFPGFVSNSKEKAVWECEAGILKADSCLLAIQNRYKEIGGELHDGEQVVSLNPINDAKIEVKTLMKTYTCKSVALTCGAYINHLLSTVYYKVPVQPLKTLVFYWKSKNCEQYSLQRGFPGSAYFEKENRHIYSIPSFEYPGLMKICAHGGPQIDPYRRDEVTPETEKQEDEQFEWLKGMIAKCFPDVDTSSPAIREVCMYTESADRKCILDFHPKYKNIVIGTGFSGSGFKTSPSVGRILASMATGKPSPYPLEPFSSRRFDKIPKFSCY